MRAAELFDVVFRLQEVKKVYPLNLTKQLEGKLGK